LEISTRLTRTAGRCISGQGCGYTIQISKPLFAKLNLEKDQGTKSGGLICKSRLECLQLVLEHEMIHLIIRMNFSSLKHLDKNITKSHGLLFKSLVSAYFGQTESTHKIGNIIMGEEQGEQLTKDEAQIGQMVSILREDTIKKGVIEEILNKNIIVKFLDGNRWKMDIDFFHKIDEDDDDYDELLILQNSTLSKYNMFKKLKIGDKIKMKGEIGN